MADEPFGRLPVTVPQLSGGGEKDWVFTPSLRRQTEDCLQALFDGMSGLQGTPDLPVTLNATDPSAVGNTQTAATSNHRHGIVTSAPAVPIQLSGPAVAGTGAPLARADDQNFLAVPPGATKGQALVINAAGTGYEVIDLGFSKEYLFLAPGGAVDRVIWQAPFVCNVVGIRAFQLGGVSGTVNARRNAASAHLAADLATTPGNWSNSSTITNAAYAVGDYLEVRIITAVGAPTYMVVEVVFART